MDFIIKKTTKNDIESIFNLYRSVAKQKGGIAREEDEITKAYIVHFLEKSLQSGICFLARNDKKKAIAEIHCYPMEPKVFRHVLSNLTIVVHPDFQKKGLGSTIFKKLISEVLKNRTDIKRIELISRESNQKAITFYQKLGFEIEGRFEYRIKNTDNTYEADIPMAWFNPNFIK